MSSRNAIVDLGRFQHNRRAAPDFTADDGNVITIPKPLANQRPILDSAARFKIVRAGRRFGKSRLGLRASILGHGPLTDFPDGRRPLRRGVVDGGTIAWIAPTYTQARAIWVEEIVPRFAGKMYCRINESQKTLTVGTGRLLLRSAESIDSLRGIKLDGVVNDEGAFFDLDYALHRVLRPALIDRNGWTLTVSSPDIGSYFNRLVAEVERGERGDDWQAWRGYTRDNPRLSPAEIDDMYSDYPPGSTDLLQELEAELLEAHGTLFKSEYFKHYTSADRNAMYLDTVRHNFASIHMYVDLAATIKTSSDFTAAIVAGITAPFPQLPKRAGVLDIRNEKLEGPESLDFICKLIDQWAPSTVGIESVGYQITAVQELQRRRPRTNIVGVKVDTDKRSRAIPFAAAMSRGDVFWPLHASFMPLVVAQFLKFPNGKEGSPHADEHDDIVDTGSMLATQLMRANANTWQMTRVAI
jgi:predicted phage terminase large subunit-like protein